MAGIKLKIKLAELFWLDDGVIKDTKNLNKFHPNDHFGSGVLLNVLDGEGSGSLTKIQFQPDVLNGDKSYYWYPVKFLGYIEHTISEETTPRTFAQYFAYLPPQVLKMNANSKNTMNVSMTLANQVSPDFLGAFATLDDLNNEYDPNVNYEGGNIYAFVWEDGLAQENKQGFYEIVLGEDNTTYEWRKAIDGVVEGRLQRKQYNLGNLIVQGGFVPEPDSSVLTNPVVDVVYQFIQDFSNQLKDFEGIAEDFVDFETYNEHLNDFDNPHETTADNTPYDEFKSTKEAIDETKQGVARNTYDLTRKADLDENNKVPPEQLYDYPGMPGGVMIYKGKILFENLPIIRTKKSFEFKVLNLQPSDISIPVLDVYNNLLEAEEIWQIYGEGTELQGNLSVEFVEDTYILYYSSSIVMSGSKTDIELSDDFFTLSVQPYVFEYFTEGTAGNLGEVYTITNDFILNEEEQVAGTNIFWDGTEWQALLGGGGADLNTDIITLDSEEWILITDDEDEFYGYYMQGVTVNGVELDSVIWVDAENESFISYTNSEIRAIEQNIDEIVFVALGEPEEDIYVKVVFT